MDEDWRQKIAMVCACFAAGRPLPGWGPPTVRLMDRLLPLALGRPERFAVVEHCLGRHPLYPELCEKVLRYALEVKTIGSERLGGRAKLARWAVARVGPGRASEMLTDRFVECFIEGDPAYVGWLFTLGPEIDIHSREDYCLREAAERNLPATVLRFLALPGGRAVGRYRDDATTLENIGEECCLEVLRAMWGLYPEEYLAGEEFQAARSVRNQCEMEAACFAGDRAGAASFHSRLDTDEPNFRRTYNSRWVIENTRTRDAAECVAEFMGSRLDSVAQGHIEALRWAGRAGWVAAVARAAQR